MRQDSCTDQAPTMSLILIQCFSNTSDEISKEKKEFRFEEKIRKQKEKEERRRRKKSEKTEKIKELMRQYGLTPAEDLVKEKKTVRFCDVIEVIEARDYDRTVDKVWTRLTTKHKSSICKELNYYKLFEMEVHPESAKYTRFYR